MIRQIINIAIVVKVTIKKRIVKISKAGDLFTLESAEKQDEGWVSLSEGG